MLLSSYADQMSGAAVSCHEWSSKGGDRVEQVVHRRLRSVVVPRSCLVHRALHSVTTEQHNVETMKPTMQTSAASRCAAEGYSAALAPWFESCDDTVRIFIDLYGHRRACEDTLAVGTNDFIKFRTTSCISETDQELFRGFLYSTGNNKYCRWKY